MTKPTATSHETRRRQSLRESSIPWVPVLLLIFVVVVFLVRWRLLDVPLERDEGEYAYAGQLLLQGTPPYELAYTMKFPGTHLMYAVLMALFGQTTWGIHLGLAVVNAASICLLYPIAREWMSPSASLMASIAFGVLSLSPNTLGLALHATHFVTLFALAGIAMLLAAFRRENLWLYLGSGALLGAATVMKQSGVFFLLFGGMAVLLHLWRTRASRSSSSWRSVATIVLGGSLPIGLMLGYIYLAGVFDNFWFWTFTYLREYGTQVTAFQSAQQNLLSQGAKLIEGHYLLWIFAFLGLVFSAVRELPGRQRVLLWLLALSAILNTLPGFYFRLNYFVPLLPVIGLLVGIFVDQLSTVVPLNRQRSRIFGAILFAIAMALSVHSDAEQLFRMSPNAVARSIYGSNPFPEAVRFGEYIRENSEPEDRVAVIGSEPEIYFYSNRKSSTGYIYTYGMMEEHGYNLAMQREMLEEIEQHRPEYIVYVNNRTSWLPKSRSPTYIFTRTQDYLAQYYVLEGVADIVSQENTVYRWEQQAREYQPRSRNFVAVYRRRGV